MSPIYYDKYKLVYTDMDSLIIEYNIECDEIMKRDIIRFDTSDYPADNAYSMLFANKKVHGLMKEKNNVINDRIRWTQSEDVRSEGGRQEWH